MDGLTRDTTPSKLFQKVANNQKIRIFALKNVLRHKYAIRHAKREVADYLDKQRTPPNNERAVGGVEKHRCWEISDGSTSLSSSSALRASSAGRTGGQTLPGSSGEVGVAGAMVVRVPEGQVCQSVWTDGGGRCGTWGGEDASLGPFWQRGGAYTSGPAGLHPHIFPVC